MANPSVQEITAQLVVLTDQVQTLTARLLIAEQNATLQSQMGSRVGGGGDSSIFDKKKLYPRELKEAGSFRTWSERVLAWISMDNDEIGQAFKRAGRQDDPLDVSALTVTQAAYNKAIYGHPRALTEGFRKAAKVDRLVKDDNGLEAWRKLVRKFDPQNAEVHAARLEQLITFGSRSGVKSLGDAPTILDTSRRALDDYEEATGEAGINEATKKTIMMQLLPPALKIATRDTLMAARTTFAGVSAEYLETIIVQWCEFDDATMGSAIPMDAGGVDAQEDVGSLGQRGVGPGLGKGGAYKAPVAPTVRRLPPGGTGGWEKYDKTTNNGFPPIPVEVVALKTTTGMIAHKIPTRANTPRGKEKVRTEEGRAKEKDGEKQEP